MVRIGVKIGCRERSWVIDVSAGGFRGVLAQSGLARAFPDHITENIAEFDWSAIQVRLEMLTSGLASMYAVSICASCNFPLMSSLTPCQYV